MILNFLKQVIGIAPDEEEKEALTKSQIYRDLYRNPLSKYFLCGYYDEELKVYYNLDDTIGIIFECIPVVFCGTPNIRALQNILSASYPDNSIIQFICYADPNVEEFLDTYVEEKTQAPDFVKRAYKSLSQFYKERKAGPIRDFRLFVALKFPAKSVRAEQVREIYISLREGLQAADLYPMDVTPPILLSFLRSLLNDKKLEGDNRYKWTPYLPLSKQILFADTEVRKHSKKVYFGKRCFRCISPKVLPKEVFPTFSNMLTGSYEGISGDIFQISSPFLLCCTIILKDQKTYIHSKANLIFQQQALGSFVVSLRRKQEEYLEAIDKSEQGVKFFPVIFSLVIYDEDETTLEGSIHRAIKLWEKAGCLMQEETVLTLPSILFSLPFGFVYDKKTMLFLDRHFIIPVDALSMILPVETDFKGTASPSLLFVGRKGQIIGLDIFSEKSPNYNFFVAAPTGKGKSFFANYIVANYYGKGVKIRIIDIGGSYKKLCNMFGGTYIDFSPESGLCFNFFETIKDPTYDLPVITEIITHMATSYTGDLPGERVSYETAINVIKSAVEYVYREKEREATIDDIYEYLVHFTKYHEGISAMCEEDKEACKVEFNIIATSLAFNLEKFTSSGIYGKWFVGRNTFDPTVSDFVVLELEYLKPLRDLFSVVVLVVLNSVTSELYKSDRQSPRLVLLDEAWQFLQDTPSFQKVVEEGYRRARKYYGSFGIITQSVLDFEQFGRVGKVINANSAFKFFLESSDFDHARSKKLLPFDDDFTFNLLKSVKYNAPRYSEIFTYTDRFGAGVLRLAVDDYSYYIYTSNPVEVRKIEEMVRSGMNYEEAIETMIREVGKPSAR